MSCFLSHDWTKWSGLYQFGVTHYERRKCIRCGATGQRQIGVAASLVGKTLPDPPRKTLPEPSESVRLTLVSKDRTA